MIVRQTPRFATWLRDLRDAKGRARIVGRLDRIAFTGNLGDVKRFGGLLEIRCDFGPGYRLYAIEQEDGTIVVLLCGGDKDTQRRDIAEAKRIAADIDGGPTGTDQEAIR